MTQDHMMLLNSVQALMAGPSQRSHSNKEEKTHTKRLPSLHIGNLPPKFYDLDLYKFI